MNKYIKPFAKWVGGKRQFIKKIDAFIPKDFKNYIEPFVGGGAVYFHIKQNGYGKGKSVINDLNSDLMAAYEAIRDYPEELMAKLDWYKENSNEEFYKDVRTKQYDNVLEKGARMIYLNKAGFNGMWRENSKGGFNVPYGKDDNKNMYDRQNILADSEVLKDKTIILSDDYKAALAHAKKGDFVFVDPPYDGTTFTTYNKKDFKVQQQIELADELKKLDKKGVKFLTTNHNTDLIKELYGEFNTVVYKANRFINSNAKKRSKSAEEIFIFNYDVDTPED